MGSLETICQVACCEALYNCLDQWAYYALTDHS
ncbi:MAG: hypothetical protein ACI854_001903, partial [Arenicella sp.]